MGAMIAGIVSVALGGFALVQPWFQAFFRFPRDSGNRLEVGEVAGTAVLYGMVAVVVFALAFAARSFLKDRGLSRAADQPFCGRVAGDLRELCKHKAATSWRPRWI